MGLSPPPPRGLQGSAYRYLDGMEELLARLASGGAEVHAFSNYPSWWRQVERRLRLSQYLQWTFVSCEPPIKVKGGGLQRSRFLPPVSSLLGEH